jgi:Cys-tRNA(Pro)/Cys-tRNA(Cys) deacylase
MAGHVIGVRSSDGAHAGDRSCRTGGDRVPAARLGGISPLGQRKRLPTTLDASPLEHETVHVSAGRRGLELELAPGDLVRLTGAEVRPIAETRPSPL